MENLTKNIWRHELACHCGCGFDTMDWETIEVVQDCCDHFAKILKVERVVLRINSAARCFEYNRKPVREGGPGSNDESQHPLARAMDIYIVGVQPMNVYDYLNKKYPNKYGLGRYGNFVHIDTRTNGPARW